MLLLISLWTLWCLLHSALISLTVSSWFQRKGGLYLALYRPGYILFSILSLLPILWVQISVPQQILFSWSGPWRIPQGILLIYAIIMFYGGIRVYDGSHFLGLHQWRAYREHQPIVPLPFRSEGILGYVRHPWYSGGIALLWSSGPITDMNLIGRSILTAYLIFGTLLEEKKLRLKLGEEYTAYCRKVPMLIPRITPRQNNTD